MLLALLAVPLLALLGRAAARPACLRAGADRALRAGHRRRRRRSSAPAIMGAAGVVAALAGRPRSRWYAVAARRLRDAGAQPARERRRRLAAQLRRRDRDPAVGGADSRRPARATRPGAPGHVGWRRALAEGAGVTIAATLATAPLMAHDFDAVSIASLPANLLALPAVAPRDVAGDAGLRSSARCPGSRSSRSPARRAARRLRRPGRALARLAGLGARRASRSTARRRCWPPTSALGPGAVAGCSPGRARRRGPAGPPARRQGAARRRGGLPRGSASGWLALRSPGGDAGRARAGPAGHGPRRRPGRRDPARPRRRRAGARRRRARPATSFAASSSARASRRLAAAVVTHDQSDHAGGIEELLGVVPGPPAALRASAAATSSRRARPPASGRGRSPRGRRSTRGACGSRSCGRPAAARRRRARATRTRRRSCCWPAGAASRCCSPPTPRRRPCRSTPGPIDVLKVAHHGSDDAGLGRAARPQRRRAWR